jgi:hypothetical protein
VDVGNLFAATKTQVAVFLEHGNKSSDSKQGTEFYDKKKTLLDFYQRSLFCVFNRVSYVTKPPVPGSTQGTGFPEI